MRRQRFGPFRIDDTYMYFLSVSQSLTRPFSQSLSRFLSLSQFLFIRGTGGSQCSWGRLAGALKDGKTIDFERISGRGLHNEFSCFIQFLIPPFLRGFSTLRFRLGIWQKINKGISIVQRSYLLLFQQSMIDAALNMQAHANVYHVEPALTLSFHASLSSLSHSAAGRMMELVLMKLPVRHTVALLRKRDPSFVHKGPYQGTLSHCHQHFLPAVQLSLGLKFQQYLYRAVM